MRFHGTVLLTFSISLHGLLYGLLGAQETPECNLREFQFRAVELNSANWIHWGDQASRFSNWTTHSNRLVPVYTWGLSLESVKDENSPYRDETQIKEIYGSLPAKTLNPEASYFDQSQIYELQKRAWKSGKKNVILVVFDGMDWQTTQATSIYRNKKILYEKGRGSGLAFLDYKKADSDFGYCVTAPFSGTPSYDVNAQAVTQTTPLSGGYSVELGGAAPWSKPGDPSYLLGKRRTLKHPWTDSAASATSMSTGRKTYNSAINVDPDGRQLQTLAHEMQHAGFAIGVVTSVPISHATPASVYAHNVHRSDYQDLTRDLLGLKSASHRDTPLEGVDVLIGCGWGTIKKDDREKQGNNFIPGNNYLPSAAIKKVDVANSGKYTVVQRTAGTSGSQLLLQAASKAAKNGTRLLGFFGAKSGDHLPFQTADGKFDPTRGISKSHAYKPADISENPTLTDMTNAALTVLQENDNGFYLMVEAGDVDKANHNNNIDDAIGAVLSGDAAFSAITKWVEQNSNWDETCLIVTADHGHMMVLDDPSVLTGKRQPDSDEVFKKKRSAKQEKDAEQKRKRAAAQARKAAEKQARKLNKSALAQP